jgi:hypothetical protein
VLALDSAGTAVCACTCACACTLLSRGLPSSPLAPAARRCSTAHPTPPHPTTAMADGDVDFLREIIGYALDQDECRQLLKVRRHHRGLGPPLTSTDIQRQRRSGDRQVLQLGHFYNTQTHQRLGGRVGRERIRRGPVRRRRQQQCAQYVRRRRLGKTRLTPSSLQHRLPARLRQPPSQRRQQHSTHPAQLAHRPPRLCPVDPSRRCAATESVMLMCGDDTH